MLLALRIAKNDHLLIARHEHASEQLAFRRLERVSGVLRLDLFGWVEDRLEDLRAIVFLSNLGKVWADHATLASDPVAGGALRCTRLEEQLLAARRIAFQIQNRLGPDQAAEPLDPLLRRQEALEQVAH